MKIGSSPLRTLSPRPQSRPTLDSRPLDRFTPECECPPTPLTTSWISKAMLVGALGITAYSAMGAQAGPVTVANTQVARSSLQGMSVTVLPQGTPRLDLVRTTREDSPVGTSLGNSLFLDVNGNLSVLPLESVGWDQGARDFQRVDLGSRHNLQRFGSTVHYSESSTRRTIFKEQGSRLQVDGPRGRTVVENHDGIFYVSGPKGLDVRIAPGLVTTLHQSGKPDTRVVSLDGELQVLRQTELLSSAKIESEELLILRQGRDEARVTRSPSGTILEIRGNGRFPSGRIIHDGGTYLGRRDKDTMTIDDQKLLAQSKERYEMVMKQLEAIEPGFADKHPVVASVLEYASANPRLLGPEAERLGFLQAGTLLATTGTAVESMSALGAQAVALNLAQSARALGAAALSAQAAAQAEAAAGNLLQAGKLASEARDFAQRAHQAKDQALKSGGKALKAANLARVMAGVGGLLQIVDGVVGIHNGRVDRSLVQGAMAVTESRMLELTQKLQGEDRQEAQADYDRVMKVMKELEKQADKKVRVGGLKIGLGGLMIVSAALGPQAPPLLGVIGIAGTTGTAVYEHWGPIKSFLSGSSHKVPTFLDILPHKDQVVIHLEPR